MRHRQGQYEYTYYRSGQKTLALVRLQLSAVALASLGLALVLACYRCRSYVLLYVRLYKTVIYDTIGLYEIFNYCVEVV